MTTRQISENIYALSVDDRTTSLFEGLWPISKEGVTYNSYLIRDKKNVVIDMTREFKSDTLIEAISKVVELKKIDYVVVNHMEPDHTGALKTLTRIAPDVEIICTPTATPMLDSFYGIRSHIREVEDGATLSIGEKELSFHHTPLVHWPETMVTYDASSGTMFSCDIFGGYGAMTEVLFDDECSDMDAYTAESLRYYSNIIAKFSPQVSKMIDKLKALTPKIVAPAHGLVWRKNPAKVIDLYKRWADYATGKGERGVTLIYASMYGNTAQVTNAVVRGLQSVSVPVNVFDVSQTHLSYILPSLWTNAGVIIGSPTYEGNIFPAVKHALIDAGAKHFFNKTAAFFGSWSWSSGALREVKELVEPFKWKVVNDLEFEGAAKESVLDDAFKLGASFGKKL